MKFEDAYEYLRYRYNKIEHVKGIDDIDLEGFFSRARHIYGSANRELYEEDKKTFRDIKDRNKRLNLPIAEQDRSSYWLLKRHSDNIERILKENNIHIPNTLVLGTLPTNELNAVVGKFRMNQILLAFDQGLFQFLYLMGRAISSFFPITNKEGDSLTVDFNKDNINRYITNNKRGHSKFVETIVLYYVKRNLLLSKTYFEKDEGMNFAVCLWDIAEFFIVAHEYSHVILGHLEYDDNSIKKFIDEESILHSIELNWKRELSADELAFQITMSFTSKHYSEFVGFIGVEFLFSCFNIIEKIHNIEINDTHPSSQMRIENLRKYLNHIFPEQSKKTIDGCSTIPMIMEQLWNDNKDIILKLAEDPANKNTIF